MATQTVQAVDHELLAAGEWMATGEWDEVLSPYDGTVVGRVAQGDAALVDRAVRSAHDAFDAGDFPQHERAAMLDIIDDSSDRADTHPSYWAPFSIIGYGGSHL